LPTSSTARPRGDRVSLIVGSLLALVGDPSLVALRLAAIPLGMIFGAVPGLGGKLGLVLTIPLVFGRDAVSGSVFLVAMHAVVHTGGSIPSILLGVPGTGPDAATVCDGHPMALKGEAGRALGASLAASAAGGVVGALFLALLIPVVQPVVLALGPAEFFFLAVLGVTFIAAVSGPRLAEGVLVGFLGLMLSFVGAEPQTAFPRFTFGQRFLYDGIPIITSVLGLFTLPELIALASDGASRARVPAGAARYNADQLMRGIGDVATHWSLTLRTSLIGAVLGLLPGLGGDVASWTAYGHAVQSSRHPERFGSGEVEGVIGPEAANNSKEGGALLPTLFFGIPGSSGMAVMLGAFVMLGIQPGPAMARDHLDLVWILIWTLVIANVLAALVFLGIGRWLALVPYLAPGLLVPFVLLLTLVGGYLGGGSWETLPLLVAIGVLGYLFKRCDWPRAPFVIGLVLGPIMDVSLHQSLAIWGPRFVLRPVALLLALGTVVTVALAWRRRRARPATPPAAPAGVRVFVAALMFALFAAMVGAALTYRVEASLVPLTVGLPAVVVAAVRLARDVAVWRRDRRGSGDHAGATTMAVSGLSRRRQETVAIVWVSAVTAAVLATGFVLGGTVGVMASQRYWLGTSWRTALTGGAVALLVLRVGFEMGLGYPLFGGLLMPRGGL
jgi:putative tricarboxylic transport membrane protein